MNNPNERLMRELIARLLGWKLVPWCKNDITGGYDFEHWHDPNDYCTGWGPLVVPGANWPTNRNATKDLPVKDKDAFFKALKKIGSPEEVDQYLGGETNPVFDSASRECVAWIFAEHGYKWVPCKEDECYNGQLRVGECPTCHGNGGEFVKI